MYLMLNGLLLLMKYDNHSNRNDGNGKKMWQQPCET